MLPMVSVLPRRTRIRCGRPPDEPAASRRYDRRHRSPRARRRWSPTRRGALEVRAVGPPRGVRCLSGEAAVRWSCGGFLLGGVIEDVVQVGGNVVDEIIDGQRLVLDILDVPRR